MCSQASSCTQQCRAEFVEKTDHQTLGNHYGNPLSEDIDLTCPISKSALKLMDSQVKLTIEQGARLVYGGEIRDEVLYLPTILDDVTIDMDIAHESGSVWSVFPCYGFDTDQEP